ncbi:hypothetical protein JKP88DRAFT_241545 [Tribonema minus]|uniref:Uncharacterized protein n=1 Tax=Tribonema minus TaxID=303371 RepID=A0A835YWC0_9STRA|nr:hypothetical protein JKP88DRAFT_241545 [Tribonema minus]
MAVPTTYGRSTLYGNWFEDRSRPLKGVLADYGHRSYVTTYSTQSKTCGQGSPTPCSRAAKLEAIDSVGVDMVQHHSMTEVLRPRPVVDAGFNSAVAGEMQGTRPQGGAQSKVFCTTTMAQQAGGIQGDGHMPEQTSRTACAAAAGTRSHRPLGERYNADADPHCNTAAQRSWLYSLDPVVKYQQEGVPALEEGPCWVGDAGNALALHADGSARRVRSITARNDPMVTQGVTVWND